MFQLSQKPLDLAALKSELAIPEAGALVSFDGLVRNHNHGRRVLKLEYEAYPVMAVKEGEKIIAEALKLFPVENIHCIHRLGVLEIGDIAVWIGVASIHRKAAFEACSHVIDQIKQWVPIWKLEHYPDGLSDWVFCEHDKPSPSLQFRTGWCI